MADKSASKRHRKRRRSTSGTSHFDEDADEQDGGRVVVDAAVGSDQEHDEEHEEEEEEEEEEAEAGEKVVASKELTVEALDSFKKKQRRKGVVYISRVPPFMKPAKVRHLLSQYGSTIERVYLVPEDASLHRRRAGGGGNKKLNYTEGWVEFADKKVAKRVAEALNATKIGGKRGNFHYDDLWNLKYLKGFKWHHLTEKIAYERRVREQRLRTEIAQMKRANAEYMSRVEQGRVIHKMEATKQSRAAKKGGRSSGGGAGGGAGAGAGAGGATGGSLSLGKVRRKFKQLAPVGADAPTDSSGGAGAAVSTGLLKQIFAKDSKKRRKHSKKRQRTASS